MKKIFLILFAVVITSVNMMAQESKDDDGPKKSPEERTENKLKRITKELVLTADQQKKVKAIILKRELEKEVRMKEEKARREKMKAEMEAEMKLILTAEQFQKYSQKHDKMKKEHPKKNVPPPAKKK